MKELKLIYIGIGIVSISLAILFSKTIEAISRNHEASNKVVTMSMVAAVFIELCVLLMIFVHMTSK